MKMKSREIGNDLVDQKKVRSNWPEIRCEVSMKSKFMSSTEAQSWPRDDWYYCGVWKVGVKR